MEIKRNGLKLYAQGSIICNESDEIDFEMIPGAHIVFKFINDSNDETSRVDKKADGNKLYIRLYNFNNPLGTAVGGFYPVGIINGKKFSLALSVDAIGEKSNTIKIVHYNWFEEEIKS